MSILEKLRLKRREARSQQATSWSQFVGDVASEKLTDVDEIDIALTRFGKSESDLQNAVDVHHKAEAARAIVAKETDLQSEIELIEQEKNRLNSEHSAAVERLKRDHVTEMNRLTSRQNEIGTQLSKIGDARVFLLSLPKDEETAEKLERLNAERDRLLRRRNETAELKAASNQSGLMTSQKRLAYDNEVNAIESRLKELQNEYSSIEWAEL